jgi:hypothetical protein
MERVKKSVGRGVKFFLVSNVLSKSMANKQIQVVMRAHDLYLLSE